MDTLQPDFSKLPETAQKRVDETVWQALEPVFTTDFKRLVWDIEYRGSCFELCLDQGRVHNGQGSLAINEIELELKSGEPQALYQAALEFQNHLPLWLEDVSKAQRGYALKHKQAIRPRPPEVLALDAGGSAGAALQAIAQHQLAWFQDNAAALQGTAGGDSLHYMLSALRNLRIAFKLYKKVLPKPCCRELKRELKWLYTAVLRLHQWDGLAHSLHLLLEYSNTTGFLKKFEQRVGELY